MKKISLWFASLFDKTATTDWPASARSKVEQLTNENAELASRNRAAQQEISRLRDKAQELTTENAMQKIQLDMYSAQIAVYLEKLKSEAFIEQIKRQQAIRGGVLDSLSD